MSKEGNNFFKILKDFWHEIEPIVLDWLVFLFIIFSLTIITNLTNDYIPPEFKEAISKIKSFLVIGSLSLSTFNTLCRILIRIVKSIIKEIKGIEEKDRVFGTVTKYFKSLTSKPIVPSAEEIELNSRARSGFRGSIICLFCGYEFARANL